MIGPPSCGERYSGTTLSSDMAYTGIGTALPRQDRFAEALSYLSREVHRPQYSVAFGLYPAEKSRRRTSAGSSGVICRRCTRWCSLLRYVRDRADGAEGPQAQETAECGMSLLRTRRDTSPAPLMPGM